jgi:hypothetical protein
MEQFTYFLSKYASELKTALYGVFLFLNIDTDIVNALIWLMLIDTAFGFTKACVMNENVSIKIMWWGLITKTLILLIPMVLALVGKGLKGYDFTPFVDVVLKVLVISEGISIITNMYIIKTKNKVKNIDFVSMLLNAIRKGMTSLLQKWLGQIENPNDLKNDKEE